MTRLASGANVCFAAISIGFLPNSKKSYPSPTGRGGRGEGPVVTSISIRHGPTGGRRGAGPGRVDDVAESHRSTAPRKLGWSLWEPRSEVKHGLGARGRPDPRGG